MPEGTDDGIQLGETDGFYDGTDDGPQEGDTDGFNVGSLDGGDDIVGGSETDGDLLGKLLTVGP